LFSLEDIVELAFTKGNLSGYPVDTAFPELVKYTQHPMDKRFSPKSVPHQNEKRCKQKKLLIKYLKGL
jgi:hypothetical protein